MSKRSISQKRHRFASTLATLSLSVAVAIASANAVAQQPEHAHSADHSAGHGQQIAATNPAAQRKAAVDSTETLINSHKQWAQARGASNKAAALENLIAKAETRREILAQLIKTNPAEALQIAIPNEKQAGMPEQVLDLLEQRMELEGELEVVIEDYDDGSNRLRHILKTPFGDRFELHLSAKGKVLQSGTRVNVYGLLLEDDSIDTSTDGDMAISENPDDLLTLAADGGATGGSNGGTATLPNTMGEQKVLVMLVNFQDDNSQPWSKATIQNRMETVDQFMRENSYQQTWLNTDVSNWMTLPISASATCNYDHIGAEGDNAARNAGINVDAYDRLVYIFPRNSCPYLGLGTVGGSPSRAYIRGTDNWETIAHELGHNLGLSHSHDYKCSGSTLGSNCSSVEYGDYADIMGAWVPGHFNAYQKDRLGWFGNNIQTITSSGTYQLSPQEFEGNYPLALKVFRGVDPVTGLNWWYYLEQRKAVGFDSVLPTMSNNFENGITVHMGDPDYGNSSFLLDMQPETANHIDAALEPGRSFSDSDAGVTITTEAINSNDSLVTVTTGGAPAQCSRANPAISVTPGESPWVAAGTSVTYTVTVTNRDSSACSNSSYSLSRSLPSGWVGNFSNSSLNLAPGSSASANLAVTSANSASDGFYTLNISAANGSYSANKDVTYVVDTPAPPANNAPVAANDSASTAANTTVNINVLNNDSDPDGDNLTVTSVSGVNGTAIINNGTIGFTPATGFSGTENFTYSVSDGNGGSDSATVSVQVSAPANQAPVAYNDSTTTEANTAVTITVLNNDSDADGDSLTVTSVSGVNGTAVINNNGTITFTPTSGFSGTETFSYAVSDGNGGSASASVSVTVNPPVSTNNAPVAVNDSATMPSVTAITVAVLNNDSDPDGDNLTVTTVSKPAKGTVSINSDGSLTYTPGNRFKNADSFSYTISDGDKTATATVSLQLQKSTGGGGKGNGKNR